MPPVHAPAQLLAEERHRRILESLAASGAVRVSALAHALDVTEETIRRDLVRLDAEAKLIRTHGGAVPRQDDRRDAPLSIRGVLKLAEKRRIAQAALAHIAHADVIALDASSSVHELARVLPDLRLTVVTNSLVAAASLADRPSVRVVVTGGVLDPASHSLVGPIAEQSLHRFNIAKAFISCRGIDPDRGLSVQADEHAGMKRRMIDLAEEVYLLADASKFGVKAAEYFAPLDDVDAIITDAPPEPRLAKRLAAHGVRIEIAADAPKPPASPASSAPSSAPPGSAHRS